MAGVIHATGPNGESLVIEPETPAPIRHDVDGRAVMSASDLIVALQESATKMGTKNPNRLLLMNAAYAIRQLVDRLAFHERDGALKVKA